MYQCCRRHSNLFLYQIANGVGVEVHAPRVMGVAPPAPALPIAPLRCCGRRVAGDAHASAAAAAARRALPNVRRGVDEPLERREPRVDAAHMIRNSAALCLRLREGAARRLRQHNERVALRCELLQS